MAVYTDAFIATEQEVQEADLEHHGPREHFPTVQAKHITPVELCALEAILTGRDPDSLLDQRLDTLDEAVVREWENTWVSHISPTLVQALLATDPNRLAALAEQWGNTETLRASDGTPADVRWLVEAYFCLARRAEREGKRLFLWIAV